MNQISILDKETNEVLHENFEAVLPEVVSRYGKLYYKIGYQFNGVDDFKELLISFNPQNTKMLWENIDMFINYEQTVS